MPYAVNDALQAWSAPNDENDRFAYMGKIGLDDRFLRRADHCRESPGGVLLFGQRDSTRNREVDLNAGKQQRCFGERSGSAKQQAWRPLTVATKEVVRCLWDGSNVIPKDIVRLCLCWQRYRLEKST